MRMSPIAAGLLAIVVLCGCKSPSQSDPVRPPFQLEWHLASAKPMKDFVEMSDRDSDKGDKKIWVAPHASFVGYFKRGSFHFGR